MNRQIKRTYKKILAFSLSAICSLSVPLSAFSEEAVSFPVADTKSEEISAALPPVKESSDETDSAIETALLAENAVHLSNAGDFIRFAERCSSDVWSQDKVFILDSDIDLSGTGFSSVPTFGGIFLGQGHTISGLSLKAGSDNSGLFRYVQECGQIYQLYVSGNADAGKSHSALALLAGSNSGLLSGCSVSCNVTGGRQAGGIAGVNEVSGIITGCQAGGTVNGRHSAGGIAGENKGTIINCVNRSFVNTTPDDNKVSLSSLNILGADASLTDLLTTENAASVTDIGGITGNNSGIIRSSINEGSVGYPHVGYNIGGIAGSQSGYIEGCVNHGSLNGRKDIGGIAGQMEPSSELEFSEDMLARLDKEFDRLHDLLTRLDADAKGSSEVLTGQVDTLLSSVENAQHAVDEIIAGMGNHLEDFANLTDLASLPSPEPVSLEFLDDLNGVSLPSFSPWPSVSPWPFGSPVPSAIPSAAPAPAGTPVPTNTPLPAGTPVPADTPLPAGTPPVTGTNGLRTDSDADAESLSTGSFSPEILWAEPPESAPAQNLDNGNPDSPDDAADTDADSNTIPTPTPSATPDNPFAAGWPDNFPSYSIDADALSDRIDREKIEADINSVQENIYADASHVLEKLQDIVQNQASIMSARVYAAQNSLSGSISAIITDTRTLNSLLNSENQILLDDIQAIIDEIHVISNIITEPETIDPDEVLADVSDEDTLSDITGKVSNCINNGKVSGDINVGGIAGTLSRENNLDPENDFHLENATLNFRYKERIVVRQCQNHGTVSGKKDRVGGIAGEMALGSIIECVSSGNIGSENGDMVGGIAGYSASTIRQSSAKCSLSGQNQIGGIAGYGTNISDCYSMVLISAGESYLGSVAGKCDAPDSDTVSNNYFAEGGPAGIDGISYQEKAQALSYEELMAREDLPDIFRKISLTFLAGDKIVSAVSLNYGDSLPDGQFPKVPAKEGYIGRWEDFDSAFVTFDQEIQAVYTEYITALESSQTVGKRPVLLLEGRFEPENELTLQSVDAYPQDAQTKAECWKLTLSGASEGPYIVRCLIPDYMEHPVIELYKDSLWQPVDAVRDGSYYVFTSEKSDIIFGCVDRPQTAGSGAVIALCLGAALLLSAALILICTSKKRRKGKD